MNIDTFLKIGHSHDICQDYILSGTDPCPYIILADGCSQAKDSDIGARILCHTALRYLKENQSRLNVINANEMGDDIIKEASITKNKFYTNIDSLDSTLIIVFKSRENRSNGYRIFMYGDGVIYWTSPKGDCNFIRVYFKPNAPGYLRYRINGYNNYINSDVRGFHEFSYRLLSKGHPTDPFYHFISEHDVQDLLIASDGVESFVFREELLYKTNYLNLKSAISKSPHDMMIEEFKRYNIDDPYFNDSTVNTNFLNVVKEMTEFKLTSGSFLSRRVKKVMKEYLKKGFINDDDLSIGCFHEEW